MWVLRFSSVIALLPPHLPFISRMTSLLSFSFPCYHSRLGPHNLICAPSFHLLTKPGSFKCFILGHHIQFDLWDMIFSFVADPGAPGYLHPTTLASPQAIVSVCYNIGVLSSNSCCLAAPFLKPLHHEHNSLLYFACVVREWL